MCLLCGKSLKGPRGLISHMAIHEIYKCNICDLAIQEIKKINNWQEHIDEHESQSGQIIKCHFCPELFIDFMSYESHLTEHFKEMTRSEAMDETPPYPSAAQNTCDMGTKHAKSAAVASSNSNDSQSGMKLRIISPLDSDIAATGEAFSPMKTEPLHTATWFPQPEIYAKPPETGLQNKKSSVKVKCHICSELLTDMKEYREHFRKVHHKTNKCKTNEMFDVANNGMSRITFRITSDVATKLHQADDHSQASVAKIVCHFCPEELPDVKSYKDHLVVHRQHAVTCGMCNMQFINKDALVNHLLNNQCSKVVKCILCSKLFTDITLYEEHMAVVHNKQIDGRPSGVDKMESPDIGNAYAIAIKSISQTNTDSAIKVENLNLDKVVNPEKRKLGKSYDDVGSEDTKSGKPSKKTRSLSNGRQQLLVCPYNCSSARRTPSELSRHMRKRHTDCKDVRCAFCDTTIRKSQIRNHLLGVHTSIKCALCDSTFSGEYCQGDIELKTHIQNSHDISVQCPLCGEMKNGQEMEPHLKDVHHLKSIGNCPVCSESKTGLIQHISGKHTNTSCTLCEKTVTGVKSFIDHIVTHQSRLCKICDVSIERTSPTNITWRCHVDKHESQCMKIIKCYFCSELFTDVNMYEEHLTGHFEQRGQSLLW